MNNPSRYSVILAGTNNSKCIVNEKNCKYFEERFIPGGDTINIKCTKCYEDLSYVLDISGKCIRCDSNSGCIKCNTDNGKKELECLECRK